MSTNGLQSIYNEITQERLYQDKKWGGADHDDTLSAVDWAFYITQFAVGARGARRGLLFRDRMICVAALAVAAIQSFVRACQRGGR